jgi:FAD/FMN-containing dehydrogenase/Fe-S oxidoreductase
MSARALEPDGSAERDRRDLADALARRVDGEVLFDSTTRGAYSTDASNFRQVPWGVVAPRTPEDAVEAVAVCHERGVPLVARGGGTSLAGQATNAAVVLDFTVHCQRLLSVDPENRRCVVEPGIVLDDLNRQLAPTGLRFGPEPATHPNCALGGMIGNNSCGATAQRTGKVVDNIASLDVLLHDGTRFTCGPTDEETYRSIERRGDRRAHIYRSLHRLAEAHGDLIRDRYPDIPRRVSGYDLDSLLPENHFDVARFLVGSEATLVTVLHAELELVPVLDATALVVLGYPDIARAADAVPEILKHEPVALEGVDRYLLGDERLKRMNPDARESLPEGTGFLFVELGGEDKEEADARAHELLRSLRTSEHSPQVSLFEDPDREARLWEVRESGLGATAHVPGHPDTYPGWEDAAVAPEKLGDYLRDVRRLYEEFGYASDVGPSLYGHFGQGCVHSRIPFDLTSADGVEQYRRFLERAAELVTSYGGSLSGEHGDGQARGELLTTMFGPDVVDLFRQVKQLFDPRNLMNPGKVVNPAPLDADLRLGVDWSPREPQDLFFGFPHDDGSFVRAANRCVGVGKCRQHSHEDGAVMCPSYQATKDERHSTRGRARLLFEMLGGHADTPVQGGWRSREVREALDLCLACKGCKTDCPASVDMATYKAEFLAHTYRHRLRPRADYATGWLPLLAQAVTRTGAAPLVNALSHAPVVGRLGTWLAGLEPREAPVFASQTLQQWWRGRERSDGERRGDRGTVLLWPDTFTNTFTPEVGRAAVAVLEQAGWNVVLPTEPLCCGLTWISTGQLTTAKRVLRRTMAALADHLESGGLVVGLEPSCTAVFRSDAAELLSGEPGVDRLEDQTVTLAELLTEHTPGWRPPPLDPTSQVAALAQVHCHQHAVMGWEADRALLEAAGASPEHLESGCCGLAGNFGFTAGHGEVSEACAEQVLLPRLRDAAPQALVLADGFSCRTQIHDLDSGGREAVHLAEVLAAAQVGAPVNGTTIAPQRPAPPSRRARTAALAGTAATALAGAGLTVAAARLARRTH